MFCFRLFLLFALMAVIPACGGDLGSGGNGDVPSFSGAASAAPGAGAGEVALTWSPALDVSGGTITYLVFGSLAGSGTEDLSTPLATTTSSSGVVVTGLTSHDPYWFIVQAQNSAGNTDGNVAEVSATPP